MKKLYTFKKCSELDVLSDHDKFQDVKLFGQSENVKVIVAEKGFVFEVDKEDEVYFFAINPNTMGSMVAALDSLAERAGEINDL